MLSQVGVTAVWILQAQKRWSQGQAPARREQLGQSPSARKGAAWGTELNHTQGSQSRVRRLQTEEEEAENHVLWKGGAQTCAECSLRVTKPMQQGA